MTLTSKKIAILTADDGVERVELTEPRAALAAAGAEVVHVTPTGGRVRTFDQTDPSVHVDADAAVGDCAAEDFDALVLPGGYINPDMLRRDSSAVRFTRAFFDADKPVGVICHGPWMLIEAAVIDGRTVAAVESLKTDIRNAGGEWVDADVHVDRNGRGPLVSGRNHDAVGAFSRALVDVFGGD